jgi:hypothetical protein
MAFVLELFPIEPEILADWLHKQRSPLSFVYVMLPSKNLSEYDLVSKIKVIAFIHV